MKVFINKTFTATQKTLYISLWYIHTHCVGSAITKYSSKGGEGKLVLLSDPANTQHKVQ